MEESADGNQSGKERWRRTRTASEKKGEEGAALIPAADSRLHGSTALRNEQVQSLPQPPLYRDARHRKQATSSECGPPFLGQRLKLPELSSESLGR